MKHSGARYALFCWLWLAAIVQAQQYVFHAYRQPEGLQDLTVNAVATGGDGFLWAATENGVYRFLGTRFERFGQDQGIAEIFARDIVADANGTVWVGTAENVYHWNGERFLPAVQAPIHVVGQQRMAVEDERHLLVVDKSRLYRLEHDATGRTISYSQVLSDKLVMSVPALGRVTSVSVVDAPLGQDRIWIGCDKKLYSLAGRIGSPLQPGNNAVTEWGKAKGLPEERWRHVLLDREGTLWVGGRDHVMVLPHGASNFSDRSVPGTDPQNIYGRAPMIEDRQGRVIVTADNGIARWNGATWQRIGRENGLLHNTRITGLAFDAQGDLWLGSGGGGIYDWVGYEDWEGWGDGKSPLFSSIWVIVPSRAGRVFLGTSNGPAWVNPGNGSEGPLYSTTRWTLGQVAAMGLGRGGSLWAATFSGGILGIDPKTSRTQQISGNSKRLSGISTDIFTAVQDEAGSVYFGTLKGIWKRESGTTSAAPQRVAAVDALLGDSTEVDASCRAPDGALWFSSGTRLFRLKSGVWTQPSIYGMPRLKGTLISLSCPAPDVVWATGQQTGTWRLTESGDRLSAWQLSLPSRSSPVAPVAILVDRRGWVWLGSDVGLMVWNSQSWRSQSWRHLTQESGLIWNDVNQNALIGDPDGSMWIGTSGGVSHLLHPEQIFAPVALTLALTSIRRGNDTYSGVQKITLPWSAVPLHFQVSSPGTRNRSELNFKIRLTGLYPDWIDSQDGEVVFHSLPPGEYTFEAMAFNPGLNAYSIAVKIGVKIIPPWWRTYWFYTLCGLVLLLLLASLDRWRANRLRKTSRRLETLVGERTRELELSREQMRLQATHDGLTGMLNRAGILDALETEIGRARRAGSSMVVALLDLDLFKRINDTHGHSTGDDALRQFAAVISSSIRAYDSAGRYGGEEFLLVLPQIPENAIELRLASLHASISNIRVRAKDTEFTVTCSMGAAVLDPTKLSENVETLLAMADRALYAAKAEGRNCVTFFDGIESKNVPSAQLIPVPPTEPRATVSAANAKWL